MIPLQLGAFGESRGVPHPLSIMAGELNESELATLAEDFECVLVADGAVWQSAAAAAAIAMSTADSLPDLVVYVTQNDPDTAGSIAQICAQIGVGAAQTLALSGHECGNIGPAWQVISDAISTGRARRVLLILADHARDERRMMRNGMTYLSDGAAACLVAGGHDPEPGFVPLWVLEQLCVVGSAGTPDSPPNLRAYVAVIRAAVAGLSVADTVERVLLANYRAASRTFLHAATGLRDTPLMETANANAGHLFGADHLLTLSAAGYGDGLQRQPAGRGIIGQVLGLAVGPQSASAFLLRRCSP